MSIVVDDGADPLDATALGSGVSGGTLAGSHGPDGLSKTLAEIEPGTLIGRYIVANVVGAGSMGTVLAAYDPKLDRKVALKLLEYRGADPTGAQARLHREAQALAKLDHPNVVSVYDVGGHGERLFVAMEFVAGQDLRAWMAAGPHPWREVLAVFIAAGRGLAAAHGADLVHRDVKPANIMLGDDGRVRVMDFGLARVSSASDPSSSSRNLDESIEALRSLTGNALSTSMTREGMLIGTPAYMAPEQLRGHAASEASDQFGYCISLHQGLYGVRPFHGASLGELLESIDKREIVDAPRTVPGWLRDVVRRGLEADPAKRWPSMDALLDALSDDPVIRGRKWVVGVGAVAALGLGAWGLSLSADGPSEAPICVELERSLDGVWDDERRAALRASLVGTGLSYAADTADRVELRLDDYAARWVRARTDSCLATARGEQSGELLDLRMACLDERIAHLDATVSLLAESATPPVDKAVEAVAELPALARCEDFETLRARQPPPEDPEVAARVEALTAELIEVAALAHAGQFDAGLERAETIASEAATLGYGPLEVRAELELASLQEDTGDYAAAEQTFEQVYARAVTLQMAEPAAKASASLIFVVGMGLQRLADGRTWAKHAEPWSKALAEPTAKANYLNTRGSLALQEGEFDLARDHYARALAIFEAALDPDHPSIARCVANLGTAQLQLGELDAARTSYTRALAVLETALGPDHPHVANVLANLGNVALLEGELDRASSRIAQALAISEASLGPNHPTVGTFLISLGNVRYGQKHYDQARTDYERALTIYEGALGPDHPGVANIVANLGGVALGQGDHARAIQLSERAMTTLEAALGADSPELAAPLVNLGQALLALGRPDEALVHLERAMGLVEGRLSGPGLAEFQFGLAQALWATDAASDRSRAIELASAAETAYANHADYTDELARVRTWLAGRI